MQRVIAIIGAGKPANPEAEQLARLVRLIRDPSVVSVVEMIYDEKTGQSVPRYSAPPAKR